MFLDRTVSRNSFQIYIYVFPSPLWITGPSISVPLNFANIFGTCWFFGDLLFGYFPFVSGQWKTNESEEKAIILVWKIWPRRMEQTSYKLRKRAVLFSNSCHWLTASERDVSFDLIKLTDETTSTTMPFHWHLTKATPIVFQLRLVSCG